MIESKKKYSNKNCLEYPFIGKDWKPYNSIESLEQANDSYDNAIGVKWTYHPDMEVRRAKGK